MSSTAVEASGRNSYHEVVGPVIAEAKPPAVETVEGDHARQGQSLVSINESVVAGQRMQQRRCFPVECRISVAAERCGPRPRQRRFQQAVVAHLDVSVEYPFRDPYQFRQRQENHSPSRRSASA